MKRGEEGIRKWVVRVVGGWVLVMGGLVVFGGFLGYGI